MGVITSITTLAGGVIGCELGIAIGRASEGVGEEGQLISPCATVLTMTGAMGGFTTGVVIDRARKNSNVKSDE